MTFYKSHDFCQPCLNVKKTHFMIFHRSRMKPVSAKISLRYENMKETNSIKFLGIIVDNKFNWHEHIIYIRNKVSRAIGIIYKSIKYANRQTVKQMYYIFYFHISYIAVKFRETQVRYI